MLRKPLVSLSLQLARLSSRSLLPSAHLVNNTVTIPARFVHQRDDRTKAAAALTLTSGQVKAHSSLSSAGYQEKERNDFNSEDEEGYRLALNRDPSQLKKILLVSTSINSLTNAVYFHLKDTTDYELNLASVSSESDIQREAERIKPDLIICPYLTKKIPAEVYQKYLCLIVHPGIVGDRGAHSLDYALIKHDNGKSESERWGVTVLQAHEEFDAGAIWSTEEFPLHTSTKSEVYHTSVTKAAIGAIDKALQSYKNLDYMPISLNSYPNPRGHKQTPLTQKRRHFDWENDSAKKIAKKINAASGQPGIKVDISGEDYFLYNATVDNTDLVDRCLTKEQQALFQPGQMIMKMNGAILLSTASPTDYLWVTHMKKKGSFKLPAEQALSKHSNGELKSLVQNLPEYVPKSPQDLSSLAWKEIHYEIDEKSGVAYLHFNFCSGAMSTDQAIRLKSVYDYLSKERSDVRAIVLMGGVDSFSNGIHLNVIHNASDPVAESTRNIEAIDDVTKSILNTTDKLVISFIRCGAGAGGVMLALAGDLVWCDSKAVLHPYYKHMGLYGSEYWTYSLPRRVGDIEAKQLTEECNPISAKQAKALGLVDQLVDYASPDGTKDIEQMVGALLYNFNWETFLKNKVEKFDSGEAEQCRAYELEQMYYSFRSKEFKESRESFVH